MITGSDYQTAGVENPYDEPSPVHKTLVENIVNELQKDFTHWQEAHAEKPDDGRELRAAPSPHYDDPYPTPPEPDHGHATVVGLLVPSRIVSAPDPRAHVDMIMDLTRHHLVVLVAARRMDELIVIRHKLEAIRLNLLSIRQSTGPGPALAVSEGQRRVERGMGQIIRRGQALGEIRSLGQSVVDLPSPRDVAHVSAKTSMTFLYQLVDGVTDEMFEQALASARADGNLSRRTLMPHIHALIAAEPKASPPTDPNARPELLRGTHRHRPARIIGETITGLEGLRMGLALLTPADIDSQPREDRVAWAESLTVSLSSLADLLAGLRRVDRG